MGAPAAWAVHARCACQLIFLELAYYFIGRSKAKWLLTVKGISKCMFCFGHIGVLNYETIGHFFFNLKVCHKFNDILLRPYGILKVDFLNFKSYAIGSGRTVASLSTTVLQSQVIFFKANFFAP